MIKRTPLEIPPPVARSFMSDMKAYHAEGKRAQFRAGVARAIRSAGFGGTKERTYLKFTDSGAALFARAARLASNIPSIPLQAVSASAKVLNGDPMTLTAAPVRAWRGRHEATKP